MKYLYCLAILFAAFPLLSKAQSNYKPGYIIGLKGDTTYGYINYREWKLSPREADFKHDLNSTTVTKVSVKNSVAFAITGYALFERHALTISMDHIDMARLSNGIDTSHVIDTVFISVINKKGPVKLYQYTDQIKMRLFVSDNNSLPIELTYRNYYDTEQKMVTQKRYVVQLVQLANVHGINSESFNEQIDNADYSEAGISKIVNKINGSEHDAVADNSHAKKSIQLYAGLALNSAIVKYNASAPPAITDNTTGTELIKGNFKRSYMPLLNLGANIYFDQRRKYFVRGELSFTGAKSNINVTSINVVSQDPYTTSATFNQLNTAISALVVYNVYNQADFKFFLSAGFSYNFSAYSNHTFVQNFKTRSQSMDDFPQLQSMWTQLPLIAGITLKQKFEFYGSYLVPATISSGYKFFEGQESAIQIGVNYYFGKN